MKKFLFALILIALPLVGNAQEHMKFMGIPIDGSASQFEQKLVTQKGMTKIREHMYNGRYFGIDDCHICLAVINNIVRNIGVFFPVASDWRALSSRYEELKENLTAKYGNPYKVVEYFDSSFADDDYSKFSEVKRDACHFCTSWSTSVGEVKLEIVNNKADYTSYPQIYLSYLDYENYFKAEAAKSDDL